MKILLVGGGGFIGNNLNTYLNNEGYDVCLPKEHLDIVSPFNCRAVLENEKPDWVINLAAFSNMSWHEKDDHRTFLVNTLGVVNLVDLSSKLGFNLIQTGSSSEIVDMNSTYAISKRAATDYVLSQNNSSKQKLKVIRPFSVYGPGEDGRRFIPTIVRSILNKKVLNLYQGVHDWVYIKDVCRAYEAMINNNDEYAEISTAVETSNLEVGKLVSEIMRMDVRAQKKDKKSSPEGWCGDPENWPTGWEPRYSLFHGLSETVKYYQNIYGT